MGERGRDSGIGQGFVTVSASPIFAPVTTGKPDQVKIKTRSCTSLAAYVEGMYVHTYVASARSKLVSYDDKTNTTGSTAMVQYSHACGVLLPLLTSLVLLGRLRAISSQKSEAEKDYTPTRSRRHQRRHHPLNICKTKQPTTPTTTDAPACTHALVSSVTSSSESGTTLNAAASTSAAPPAPPAARKKQKQMLILCSPFSLGGGGGINDDYIGYTSPPPDVVCTYFITAKLQTG